MTCPLCGMEVEDMDAHMAEAHPASGAPEGGSEGGSEGGEEGDTGGETGGTSQ